MTSKERVLNTVAHQQPDRPPIFATLTPQVAEKLGEHLKTDPGEPIDSMLSTRISHTDMLVQMGNDCVGIAAAAANGASTTVMDDGLLVNEWGMKFKPVGLYTEFYVYPLAGATSVADVEKYPIPDPLADGRYDHAAATVKKYGNDYAVVGDLECSMFEMSWYLVGFDKFLMDLSTREAYALALLDRVLEYSTAVGLKLIELGADIIWAGDDYGTQRGLLISPQMWREICKPRIKQMFDAFKKANPDIKLAWHSCGSILPIIPDFIEIGLDILNPLQPMATGMEPEFIKKEYGKDLAFFGAIDVQNLLPFGSPDEIKAEVTRRIDILGAGGGYIVAPAHNIQPDTSVENILAMYEAVKNYSYD